MVRWTCRIHLKWSLIFVLGAGGQGGKVFACEKFVSKKKNKRLKKRKSKDVHYVLKIVDEDIKNSSLSGLKFFFLFLIELGSSLE